jgi:putative protease
MQPSEIRVDLEPAQKAVKGVKCSIAVPERLRRSDKVYIFE